MRKKILSTLLITSLLASTAARAVEFAAPEEEKIEEKKASWTSVQYARAKKAAKEAPRWVWWTTGGVLSLAAITGVSVYYSRTGGFSSFLSWISNQKSNCKRKGFFFGQNNDPTLDPTPQNLGNKPQELGNVPGEKREEIQEEQFAKMQRDLRKVRDAVVDLERDAYGTTFLDGSPKVQVDGKDILIIKPADENPA